MDEQRRQDRDSDLVLPPNTYAYVLDTTKGKVNVCVGPYKASLSTTDQLVIWDEHENEYENVHDVESAKQTFQMAAEGQYVTLQNPSSKDGEAHPLVARSSDAIDLDVGRKIIIAGPANFPLWPGQTAQTIDGHHLRHNQYVLVRVYEPEQAAAHAGSAVMAPQTGPGGSEGDGAPEPAEQPTAVLGTEAFTMGQLIVMKGTEVSFYMPSTGIEVVPEGTGQFVREAATLERLEYCILLDENGEKRYMYGPDVVFPQPTETFIVGSENRRKFKAIELNEQSGLYIKVIAPYTAPDGTEFTGDGEELFITGAQNAIYFPRPEHNIIEYGGQKKHHAIAIPSGEGRYVLDRTNGKVELVTGPKMFLPDPRTQVIVRRILDEHTLDVLYPGNEEAREVNQGYRQEKSLTPEDFLSSREARGGASYYRSGGEAATMVQVSSGAPLRSTRRSTSYTPPRTITLSTKYEGAVEINIWPGYAVMVTDKSGNRRVEVGPKMVLLQYDESPMTLSLSRGRPKSDKDLIKTAYLRTVNNQVSDQITVETQDLVQLTLDLSLRVSFEDGSAKDRLKWFEVENYVQLLTDHCRSRLRNAAKRHDIRTFNTQTIDIVRDTLLGEVPEEGSRPGLLFEENGMRLSDVEVLNVEIDHPTVAGLLTSAMTTAITSAIELSEAENQASVETELERLKRDTLKEHEKTQVAQNRAALDNLTRQLEVVMGEAKIAAKVREESRIETEQTLALDRAANEVDLEQLKGEVEQFIARAKAIDPSLIATLQQYGDQAFVERLVEGLGGAALALGVTSADIFKQAFEGTPFAGIMDGFAQRPYALATGNGSSEDD